MKVGTVQSIWRYPVKGMAGEPLSRCWLDANGLQGDRTWAVQDVKRREIQSCKFRPELLRCRAGTLNDGSVSITFPGGETLRSDDPEASERVSQLVGHNSLLQARRPASDKDFYRRFKKDNHTWLEELKATFEREPGEPLPDLDNLPKDMQEYVSVVGSFFLVSPLHILTTASLAQMKALNPGSDWHLERFRPNIVIDTDPAIQGLAEQHWLDHKIQIGKITIDCNATAPRCGAVIRKQGALPQDKSILRNIVREADQNLGIYGNAPKGGEIKVGDDVLLLS